MKLGFLSICSSVFACAIVSASFGADNLLPAGGPAWTIWAPRPELNVAVSSMTKGETPTFLLRSSAFAQFSQWRVVVPNISAGRFYTLSVAAQLSGVKTEALSAISTLTWFESADGSGPLLQVDYVDPGFATDPDGWRERKRTLRAPEGAHSVRVELGLRWTDAGEVRWRNPRLVESEPPAPRRVRLATTRIKPPFPTTIEANRAAMVAMIDRAAREHPDVILFSENLAERHTNRPLRETAEPIPGPTTDALAEAARRHHTYIITTLHERDGELFHNTAVVIDRDGRIVGKYRKTHLTVAEALGGMTPGRELGVFDTDFGRIGVLTCWDNWFVETVRELRLRGAEIVFLPLAADGVRPHWDAIAAARAMDNGVYLVSSPTENDIPASIISPAGEVLASADDEPGYVVREVDLNKEWRVFWLSVPGGLGEPRSLYFNERRPDLYEATSAGNLDRFRGPSASERK